VKFVLEAPEGTVASEVDILIFGSECRGQGVGPSRPIQASTNFLPRSLVQPFGNEAELNPVGNGVGSGNLPLTGATTTVPACLVMCNTDSSFPKEGAIHFCL
jgi:hypothetical protein